MKIQKDILLKREVIFMASLFLWLSNLNAQLFNFKKLSVEDGLSAHGVYSFSEGPKGRLWIGLEGEGLNIYDGYEINRLKDPNLGKNIRAIYKDSKDRMWVGSEFNGISIIDGESVRKINREKGLTVNSIRGFSEDPRGGVWVATLGGGLYRFLNDSIDKKIGLDSGLPSLRCRSVLCAGSSVFVGTDNGLAELKEGRVIKVYKESDGLSSDKILAIKKGFGDDLWIGTQKGLGLIRNKKCYSFRTKDGLLNDRIKDVLVISNQELWVATRAGLGKVKITDLEKRLLRVKWYDDQNGLSNNRIRCLYMDASKALWIGTYFGGVNRFFNESFSLYDKSSGLLDNVITAVNWNGYDSSLWMGSHENGIDVWSKDGLRSINKLVGLSENQVTSVTHFNDSLSLVGTNEGLNLIKNYEVDRVWDSYDGLFTGNYISSIKSNENCAIGLTNKNELFVIRNDSNETVLDSVSTEFLKRQVKYLPLGISVIGESFWVGTDSLLYQFIFDKNQPKLKSEMGIRGVLNLVGENGVFVGYTQRNELFKFKKDSIIWRKKFKKSEEIRFVIPDSISSYWFGLKGRMLNLKFLEDSIEEKIYSLSEGFMGESALKSAVTKDGRGYIYVGTIKGMLKFEPKGYVGVKRDLKVYFENLLINNAEFDWGKYSDTIIKGVPQGLVLPHRMNHLIFEFKAFHLKSPKEVVYKIELKGEQEYSYETNDISEEFHDLPPGSYQLKIFAKTQWGEWSSKPFDFEFEIKPPFWMTKAFQVSLGLLLVGFLFVIYKLRTRKLEREKRKLELLVEERTKDLNDEKQKSEKLLLNILPVEVANELKVNGFAKTRKYEKASVLFTDFKGFTKMSSEISAEKLVKKLDEIFVAFDEVIGRNNLEKIKTIGDAYMCASGIPDANPNQVKNIVLAGLQLVEVMEAFNKKQRENHEPEWDVRVGIHTGELIAGVVGKKKFAYDVWGDTVNVASRMESNSEPGKVNISKATYDEVQLYFNCVERGKIAAKNRGELDMYFVESLKEGYQKQNSKLRANQMFYSNIEA